MKHLTGSHCTHVRKWYGHTYGIEIWRPRYTSLANFSITMLCEGTEALSSYFEYVCTIVCIISHVFHIILFPLWLSYFSKFFLRTSSHVSSMFIKNFLINIYYLKHDVSSNRYETKRDEVNWKILWIVYLS